MALRDTIVRILSRGTAEPLDDDEPIELATVRHHEGPLVVAELRNGGVEAASVDVYNVVVRVASDSRIMVRRGDLEAAQRIWDARFSHELEWPAGPRSGDTPAWDGVRPWTRFACDHRRMDAIRPVGLAARAWGAVAIAPSRLVLLVQPAAGAADDEDAFSGGDGGDWVWYPKAGSMHPRPLPRWWAVVGRGGGVVGTLTRRSGRVRFVPAPFWRRRGWSDWERSIDDEAARGPWLLLSAADGDVVLRHRRGGGFS